MFHIYVLTVHSNVQLGSDDFCQQAKPLYMTVSMF